MVGKNSGKRNPDHKSIHGQAVRRYRSSCQGHSVEARQVCRHKLKPYLAKCAYIERTVCREQQLNRSCKQNRVRGVHFGRTIRQVISERQTLRLDNVSLFNCSYLHLLQWKGTFQGKRRYFSVSKYGASEAKRLATEVLILRPSSITMI